MPIKLDANIQHFAIANRDFQPPRCLGDIVYGWDNHSPALVIGAYRGEDNEFDSKTGAQIKKRYKIMVMSWQDQTVMSFDNAMSVPKYFRARVITPDGTGTLETINDDGIYVWLDKGPHECYSDPDNVQLFDWDRINAIKTSNDQ